MTKYDTYWSKRKGKKVGSPVLPRFKDIKAHLTPLPVSVIIDIGTGPGYLVDELRDYTVIPVDIANSMVKPHGSFVLADIADYIPSGDYGICVDVLEHIEPEDLDKVLTNIKNAVPHGYLVAATFPLHEDDMVLHTIVESDEWWAEKFNEYFNGSFILEGTHCAYNF